MNPVVIHKLALVKAASTSSHRSGIRDRQPFLDTIMGSSDRAGEIEAVLESQGKEAEGLGELLATHPQLASYLGGGAGALGGGLAGVGTALALNNQELLLPLGLGGGLAGLLLGKFGTNALTSAKQEAMVRELDKRDPDKAKLKAIGERANPTGLGILGGLPYGIGSVMSPMGDAERGRAAIARRVNEEPLSFGERNPRTMGMGLALPGMALGGLVTALARE